MNLKAIVCFMSLGLTPVQYAEKYLGAGGHAMDLKDTILGYYHEYTYNYVKYLIELIEKAVLNDRIYNNSITIDIGAQVKET